jgi:hypothetical protein
VLQRIDGVSLERFVDSDVLHTGVGRGAGTDLALLIGEIACSQVTSKHADQRDAPEHQRETDQAGFCSVGVLHVSTVKRSFASAVGRRVLSDQFQVVRRVPLPLDSDLRGSVFDLAQVGTGQLDVGSANVLF